MRGGKKAGKKVCLNQGCKNDNQMEITQRQRKEDCTLNIATNLLTMFPVIPTKDDRVMLWTSKKCYKNKDRRVNNLKFAPHCFNKRTCQVSSQLDRS